VILGFDFGDIWNLLIAGGICIAVILLIIMIIAAAAIYAPKHTQHGIVFNRDDSLRYLYYSFAAYNSPALGKIWNCPYCIGGTLGMDVTTICQYNDTYAYVGFNMNHKEVVVSFRGTANEESWIIDVLQNIKTPPTISFPGLSGANVYQVFWQQYQIISPCVTRGVQQLLTSSYPVSIVGHGLGGTFASFLSMDLLVNQKTSATVKLWTYGAPRAGNKAYADAVGSRLGVNSQRMINYDDCVPHEPQQQLGYWREPTEVWDSTGNGDFRVCDSSGEDPHCSNSLAENCVFNLMYMGIQCCSRP